MTRAHRRHILTPTHRVLLLLVVHLPDTIVGVGEDILDPLGLWRLLRRQSTSCHRRRHIVIALYEGWQLLKSL